ncbi:MAG TPA: DNA polymerase III subunit beta [Marinagarivorans sp.]
MQFSIARDALLKPLQLVAGVVERRQTMPVLANVLLVLEDDHLSLTGTDLEVEIVGRVKVERVGDTGEITVPAKKFLDICKNLPDGSTIDFSLEDQKVNVYCGKSRFNLSTLPASEFPAVESGTDDLVFNTQQKEIKRLIERTGFAMAQQDVRYYLNGMLWELRSGSLRAVATDGHRLAMCTRAVNVDYDGVKQAILPRKGVVELSRLLNEPEGSVQLVLGATHIRAHTADFTFTSKLVDGKFPDYERVLPRNGDKIVMGEREALRQAFTRTAILANEKYRGVRFVLSDGVLTVTANNPEQEEAEEQISVDYQGGELEVGFNVSYLQDVSNVIDSTQMKLTLSDTNSSVLIEDPENSDSVYVVMPMRL